MAKNRRLEKVNALLREAIANVILKDIEHPIISNRWITVTKVSLSADLQNAHVYVSVMPNKNSKEDTLKALQESAGYIACKASKNVILKYFPSLNFYLDDIYSPQDHIENLLWKIKNQDS